MKKTHTFRGKKWKVIECPRDAEWHGMTLYDEKTIYIANALSDKHRLETLAHEALHACNSDLSEDCVEETARDIAKFLWEDKWRKT